MRSRKTALLIAAAIVLVAVMVWVYDQVVEPLLPLRWISIVFAFGAVGLAVLAFLADLAQVFDFFDARFRTKQAWGQDPQLEHALKAYREHIKTEIGPVEAEFHHGIWDLIDNKRRVIVVGDPGMENVALASWLAHNLLVQNEAPGNPRHLFNLSRRDWTPILIRNQENQETGPINNLDDLLDQSLIRTLPLQELQEVVKQNLVNRFTEGKAILIIDGVNEAEKATHAQRVEPNPFIRMLRVLSDWKPKGRILVTAKKSYGELLDQFQEVNLSELVLKEKDGPVDHRIELAIGEIFNEQPDLPADRWEGLPSSISGALFSNLRKIERRNFTELGVDEHLRELISFSIYSADQDQAEKALQEMISTSAPEVVKPELFYRACACTAAYCLAEKPGVSAKLADEVIEFLLLYATRHDGFDLKLNTFLDEAVSRLAGSISWGKRLRERLLDRAIESKDYKSQYYGGLCMLADSESLLDSALIDSPTRERLHQELKAEDQSGVVRACLALVNRWFYEEVEQIPADNYSDLVKALFNVIRHTPEAAWAAVWALRWHWYRCWRQGEKTSLSESRAETILQLLQKGSPGTFTVGKLAYLACYSLTRHEDYILNWAHVADNGVTERQVLVEKPEYTPLMSEIVARIETYLEEPEPELERDLALSLGYLGISHEKIIPTLFQTLADEYVWDGTRDFAVVGLVQTGGLEVIEGLVGNLNSQSTTVDVNNFVKIRSFLALIGINDEEALPYLLRCLRHDSPETRYYCAAALSGFSYRRHEEVMAALQKAVEVETDPTARAEMERVVRLSQKQSFV